MIKLQKASELALSTNKMIVVYGQGGVGKTFFASNNKSGTFILQVEDDGGLETISKLEDDVKNSTYASLVNQNGSPIGMVANALMPFLKEKHEKIDTIILDSLTNLRSNQASYISKTELSGAQPRIQDWGIIKMQLDNFFKLLVDLKKLYNIVIICHEEVQTSNDTSTGASFSRIVPAGGDFMSSKYEQFADEIVRIFIKDDKRTFDFSGSNSSGKTRKFGNLSEKDKIKNNMKISELL